MRHIFIYTILFVFISNSAFATVLELSDIIKTARESEMSKKAPAKVSAENISSAENKTEQTLIEKNSSKEIKTNEILKTPQ